MAGRAGLRLHAGLRAGDGGAGAGGDRPAAAPEPRGDVVGGAQPAQAGVPVDGDDAGDHLEAALRDQGRGALRVAGQGPGGAAAGAGGRGPALHPVHHRAAGRHRGDADRAGRDDLRAPRDLAPVRRRPGGDRPELPGQAGHRDAARRRPRPGRVPGRDRGHPAGARPEGAGAGAPQPGRPGRVPGPARGGRRRLGRGLPADAGPREPRAALAVAGPAARRSRPSAGSSCGPGSPSTPSTSVAGEPWLDPRVSAHVAALAGPDGLAVPACARPGCPGRSPTAGSQLSAGLGRTDLHAAVDTEGRTDDRRGLRERLRRLGRRPGSRGLGGRGASERRRPASRPPLWAWRR